MIHSVQPALDAIRAAHAPESRAAVWDVVLDPTAAGGPRLTGWTSVASALAALQRLEETGGLHVAVGLLPDPALGGAIGAIARRSVVHLRREPRHTAELVSQMVLGDEAVILRAAGEWLQVQTGDGYVAWAHRYGVVERPPGDPAAFRARVATGTPPPGAWVVVARHALIRAAAAADAPTIGDLVQGARLVTDGNAVTLPDGSTGWVDPGVALPAGELARHFPRTGAEILRHGAHFLGVPYLWGGTTEKGYDCSGFVQRLFGLHGVALPRDSDQQAGAGVVVPPGEAVADGDLAFFSERPDGRISHVGILTAGGERMLHASTRQHGVAWDGLEDGRGNGLIRRLRGIRRVL
ncbi:MAG: NlpC/P60 family protein [Gemmatimonadota bacterium]